MPEQTTIQVYKKQTEKMFWTL